MKQLLVLGLIACISFAATPAFAQDFDWDGGYGWQMDAPERLAPKPRCNPHQATGMATEQRRLCSLNKQQEELESDEDDEALDFIEELIEELFE